jgi:hypothetical protein
MIAMMARRIAPGDAFGLGHMEGVELVGVARALAMDAPGALQRLGAGCLARGIALDLAGDVADQPPEKCAEFAQMAHALLVAAPVQQARGLAAGMARDAGVCGAFFSTCPFSQPAAELQNSGSKT